MVTALAVFFFILLPHCLHFISIIDILVCITTLLMQFISPYLLVIYAFLSLFSPLFSTTLSFWCHSVSSAHCQFICVCHTDFFLYLFGAGCFHNPLLRFCFCIYFLLYFHFIFLFFSRSYHLYVSTNKLNLNLNRDKESWSIFSEGKYCTFPLYEVNIRIWSFSLV